MPIANAKARRIAAALIEQLYLGVRAGANQSVADYQRLKSSDPAQALAALTRAINMPRRAKQRLAETARLYNARFGSGFVSFLAGALTLYGAGITVAEISSDLDAMEAAAASVIAQQNAGTLTTDAVAAWITANWANDVSEWQFPFPVDYADQPLVASS